MSKEYPNFAQNSSNLNTSPLLKESISEATSSYWLYIAISVTAAIIGLYFFSVVAIQESKNQLDNYALIARACIFVLAKAVLFHYLNKKSKQDILILFICGCFVSVMLLGFEIWSITISARDFIEKPVASYDANKKVLENCDSKIELLKNNINDLQSKGFERINSQHKKIRESSQNMLDQSNKKQNELSKEIARCDSIRVNNTPPRFVFWGELARFIYSWGMSIIIVLVSDLFAAMAGHEKKDLRKLLLERYWLNNTPPLDDGSDPKGKHPSLEKNNAPEFSVDLSKNGQMASGDHVLKLVMQNEISGCGIATMAMIFDCDFFKTKSIYPGEYNDATGTNTKEISDYINSVGLKTKIPEIVNASSLMEISSNDVLYLCVRTKNDCMHGCLFEKGSVYCPLCGIMTEDDAFKNWKEVCRVELIKCEDIIKWRNGIKMSMQAPLASPVSASLNLPDWVRTDSLKSYSQPLKKLNGHPANALKNKELIRVNTRIDKIDVAHGQVDKMEMYKIATKAKAGEGINCPWCAISFTKKTYNHRFCNPSHKDEFWNAINPTRLKAKGKMKGKKKAEVLRVVKQPKLTIVKGA